MVGEVMRLICPNCDAEYEVDDNVVPKDGRDVQCSSCGQTWFQKSALQLQQDEQAEKDNIPPQAPEQEQEQEQEQEIAPDPETDQEPEPTPEAEAPSEPQRVKHDEAVLDVLRQEAAFEADARHQEEMQGGLETQPDLGLDQADDAAAAVGQRTARLRGIETSIDKQTSRSDLLPDIEEINSSLQAESSAETQEARVEKSRGRGGFRLGFGLILISAILLLLGYVYAPQIIEKMPASEAFMTSYVEKIDSLRMWLDQMMKTATDKMSTDTVKS